ncbi:MAG: serine protease [Pseudobacter sp.]|uniref:serine protease n=1 Tax=Pseudobacter sp. TaxID=2045420 RepID=UPI003F822867
MEVLENLPSLLKLFWFIAIPVSIIFLIQTIMTFVGADTADGLSADFDSDLHGGEAPFQLFSLRNLVNFLLGFSWGGISFYTTIPNQTLLITVALAIGISFIFIFFLVIRQVQKLGEDNSFRISNTISGTAEVYLAIPAQMSGKGKVLISIKGSMRELEAMTAQDRIPTGSVVRVIKVESDNILIVEKI